MFLGANQKNQVGKVFLDCTISGWGEGSLTISPYGPPPPRLHGSRNKLAPTHSFSGFSWNYKVPVRVGCKAGLFPRPSRLQNNRESNWFRLAVPHTSAFACPSLAFFSGSAVGLHDIERNPAQTMETALLLSNLLEQILA